MTPKIQRLFDLLSQDGFAPREALNEITIEVSVAELKSTCEKLKGEPRFGFEQLVDLCGVDYAAYGDVPRAGPRFAVVLHLLSLANNWRLRVRAFCDDAFPVAPSLVELWSAANWYEREAFDLFGIMFDGHPDLRRILTDYGFVGHPFRKDFPLSGHVEMRYDPEQKRIIYQPVTIDPREVTPRIVREKHYAEDKK